MNQFAILNNRKRAVIALVHTVVFLLIAVIQTALSRPAAGFNLHGQNTPSTLALLAIYSLVTTILLALFRFSRAGIERLYFACCATSASFGLFRSLAGDPPLHFAQYIRVFMLLCAVLVGTHILRAHSAALLAE
ncbi:MAG TPA: hypothetical protein VFM10_04475 [Terriglobales bacterium]|jgi:hypothetical protein|nr:hypothetical protein [Terriglobales bacterium]